MRRRPLLLAGFALALAVTLFFGLRLVMVWLHWSDPAMRSQPLEGWMTPRYVAHARQVPPEVIAAALGPLPGRGLTLAEIAEARGLSAEALIAELEAALAAHGPETGVEDGAVRP